MSAAAPVLEDVAVCRAALLLLSLGQADEPFQLTGSILCFPVLPLQRHAAVCRPKGSVQAPRLLVAARSLQRNEETRYT